MMRYNQNFVPRLPSSVPSRILSGGGVNSTTRKVAAHLTAVAAAWMLLPATAKGADVTTSGAISVPLAQVDERHYGDFRDTLHGWKVTVGAGAMYLPEYEGSDKFHVQPLPLFSASFGDRVHINTKGLTLDIVRWNGFKVSARGGYEMGRKEDDSDYLRGLGDIDVGGVVGGILSYEAGPFQVYAGLDKTIGGSEGLTSTFGAKVSHNYQRFTFSADASATWADDKHMKAYFGISPTQSARSGLAQYEAAAGIKRVGLSASVTYRMADNWMVTGSGGTGLLVGDAKDSPVVKDDVQPFVMLGIGYRF